MHFLARSIALALLWWAAGLAHGGVPEASVVKIRAVAADGEVKWGSAVVVGPERIATTCHVTRRATTIEVSHDGERWQARAQAGSAVHDLCVLTVEGLHLPSVRVRAAQDLAPGERVTAAGFEHGESVLVSSVGTVKSLYRYDEGMVIRTSAAFDFGSSGGGLFDEAGNLVGLLAFKARTGTDLRFALPSEWLVSGSAVAANFEPIDPAAPVSAFWERPAPNRPSFLGVALREAQPAP
jgi:S1-C subfamily serine protease